MLQAGCRLDLSQNGVMKPRSVLLITPQWARDGGVGAHVQASARVLAREGIDVTVLVERVASDERFEGVALYQREQLCDTRCAPEARRSPTVSLSWAAVPRGISLPAASPASRCCRLPRLAGRGST